MRSPLMSLGFALVLAACGGGGGAPGAFEGEASEEASASLADDPVYVALETYIARTGDTDARGFTDNRGVLDAYAALVRELQEAMAAAGALSNLDVFLDAGGAIGFGAYDASGIFDPLGRPDPGEPDAPDGATGRGSFYFLFGPRSAPDPFDVGQPGRSTGGHPLMPDVAGAISGVASDGRSTYVSVGRESTTVTVKINTPSNGATIRETTTPDPTSGGDQPTTVTETHITADGRVDRYSVDKYDGDGVRVYGERWTDDQTLTIYQVDENGDGHVSTLQGVEYKEVAVNELTDPDSAPGDLGCLLPWLCDDETPGETLLIWSKGGTRTLPAGPGEDGGIETRYVAPFLTQFDVLSNPGYIDGLIIYDPSAPPRGPHVPPEGPVHE